ncbi:hypothetical protein ABZ234_08195 [Nocardiopsis sp. NPDC006198]|uniref:hypothetical protein n=1 Tax=Nocardiopsis sp. NPDC006198 TaxID=3154472 RepID=UPI0033B149E3
MVDEDALLARLTARQCWDAETLRGPATERLASNENVELPRGLAHQGRYALRLLNLFDGDLGRLRAAALRCRELAQEEDSHRQAMWMRATDLCEQAVARVTTRAGADPDHQQSYVHRLMHPEPDPAEELAYRVVWVATLPAPHNLFRASCMTPLSTAQRWARQARPTRTPRSCCRYHAVDWHRASRGARRLLRQARRGAGPVEEVYRRARALAARAGWDTAQREAALSLLSPAEGIIVSPEDSPARWFLLNGQHRTQALLEAGVRRTVVLRAP